ncbi:acetyltransferase [Minicystis rosea]|nr:acetyltransferase [Minicystis rosea]
MCARGPRGALSRMDRRAVLAAFDEQIRQRPRPEEPGARVERAGSVVRHVAPRADGWSGVLWSALDASSADMAIAMQVRDFSALGRSFEWKHYTHDLPADLGHRLLAAGFVAEPEEALMVAEIETLDQSVALPPGIRLLPVTDAGGVEMVVRVHEEVFGVEHGWLRSALLGRLAETPPSVAAVVALVGDAPVCSARVELHEDTEFASLWGGGTLPGSRGQGVYRATVAHRARIARERGFRYLFVDALPESRAILERLGFIRLSTTTPYVWSPSE